MTTRYKQFTSIGFFIGLSILLLNDLYLKGHFNNLWTGKLSDFAGLFIFPIFWTILFPRHKVKIYLITTLFFIYWKSPYSQNFINIINILFPFKISRIIDYSDYLALTILPLSYYYNNLTKKYYLTVHPIIILIISSFSFLATSYRTHIDYKKDYAFNYPIDSLEYRIYNLKYIQNTHKQEQKDSIIEPTGKFDYFNEKSHMQVEKFFKDTIDLFIFEDFCFEGYSAEILISGDKKISNLKLLGFDHVCPKNEISCNDWKNDKKILSESFEKKIIMQLKKFE